MLTSGNLSQSLTLIFLKLYYKYKAIFGPKLTSLYSIRLNVTTLWPKSVLKLLILTTQTDFIHVKCQLIILWDLFISRSVLDVTPSLNTFRLLSVQETSCIQDEAVEQFMLDIDL